MRRGFTLVELLIVMAVIIALMAMGYGVWATMQARARAQGTQAIVAAALLDCPPPGKQLTVTCRDGTPKYHWTLGQSPGDESIDGDPARYPAAHVIRTRAPDDYRGFVSMSGFTAPAGVNALGQPLDRYGRPLRARFDPAAFGPGGYGVWSAGPDGLDGTADDIVSWDRPDP